MSAYTLAVGGYIVGNLFNDPRSHGCIVDCPPNLLLIHDSPRLDDLTNTVLTIVAMGVLVAACAVLAWHWRTATAPARLALAPVVWGGTAGPRRRDRHRRPRQPVRCATAGDVVPLASARLRGDPRRLPDRRAPHPTPPGPSRRPGGHAQRDATTIPATSRARRRPRRPHAQVAFWMPGQQRYVDVDGQPLPLPRRIGTGGTVLDDETPPTAALIHDPSLLDDPALVAGAAAAARLALDNARLQAELLAQLAEVRASAAASWRPATPSVDGSNATSTTAPSNDCSASDCRSRLARGRLVDSGRDLEELLTEAEAELDGTLEELRALARGIHPAVLTDEGLTPALETLARRAPIPVTIDVSTCRPPSRTGRGRRLLRHLRSPRQRRQTRTRVVRHHGGTDRGPTSSSSTSPTTASAARTPPSAPDSSAYATASRHSTGRCASTAHPVTAPTSTPRSHAHERTHRRPDARAR